MRSARVILVVALFALLASTAVAQTDYVILAKGQGKGSTAFAANMGRALVANLEDMGLVLARSSDPNFANWAKAQPGVQDVAADQVVQWLSPKELNVEGGAMQAPRPAVTFVAGTGMAYNLQWNIPNIHADATAAAGILGRGAVVAVVDAGLIADHPEIKSNVDLALSKSFVPGEVLLPPANAFNHGTHVAGIIAGTGYWTQGVAPAATLVGVKVLSGVTGSGKFGWIIEGIDYASGPQVQADIINMSLGATFPRVNAGGGGLGSLISALNRAINTATRRGTLVITSAGNDAADLNAPSYNPDPALCDSEKPCSLWSIPAQLGNGIAVSAITSQGWGKYGSGATFDIPATYTNYGQSVINVAAPGGDAAMAYHNDPYAFTNCFVPYIGVAGGYTRPCYVYDYVFAPGAYITDANNNVTGYSWYWATGTSMAAPHVSGVAALIVGQYGHHVLSPAQIQTILQNTADDILTSGADPYSGKGRVNAAHAVGVSY